MTTFRNAGRIVLAWIALLAAQMLAGMAIKVSGPSAPNVMNWLLLSDAITALALGAAALRSDWRDWRLAQALFFVPAAIVTVNMIEGVLFLPNAHIDWRGVIALTLLGYAIAAILWLQIFRGAPVPPSQVESPLPHHSTGQIIGRVVLCSACYVFLYFLAGTIIFPYVRDFYATQRIPPVGEIVALQFFLRGPVFLVVCLVLLRMFRLPHMAGALATGLAFTLLSGLATLIIPNTTFPDAVRWVHCGEVTSSNFVFGCVVGWIWGHREQVAHLKAAHA
jgi:hypothetical protein